MANRRRRLAQFVQGLIDSLLGSRRDVCFFLKKKIKIFILFLTYYNLFHRFQLQFVDYVVPLDIQYIFIFYSNVKIDFLFLK